MSDNAFWIALVVAVVAIDAFILSLAIAKFLNLIGVFW